MEEVEQWHGEVVGAKSQSGKADTCTIQDDTGDFQTHDFGAAGDRGRFLAFATKNELIVDDIETEAAVRDKFFGYKGALAARDMAALARKSWDDPRATCLVLTACSAAQILISRCGTPRTRLRRAACFSRTS